MGVRSPRSRSVPSAAAALNRRIGDALHPDCGWPFLLGGIPDMRLDTSQQMRTDMRLRMAPRMIQSMEILQLPLMALQERIDQELSENPVLVDLREAPAPEADAE